MDNITLIAASAFLSMCLAVARSTSAFMRDTEASLKVRGNSMMNERPYVLSQNLQNQFLKDPLKQMCIKRLAKKLEYSNVMQRKSLVGSLDTFCRAILYSTTSDERPVNLKDRVRKLLRLYNHSNRSFLNQLASAQATNSGVFLKDSSILDVLKYLTVTIKLFAQKHNMKNPENSTIPRGNILPAHEIQGYDNQSSKTYLSNGHYNTSYVYTKRTSEPTLSPIEPEGLSPLMCKHRVETKLVLLAGCLPKSVLTTRCQGSCHSRSVPEWDEETQDLRNMEHCTCCTPNSMRVIDIRFRCPRRPRGFVTKRVAYPFRCSCRPCAIVGDVE